MNPPVCKISPEFAESFKTDQFEDSQTPRMRPGASDGRKRLPDDDGTMQDLATNGLKSSEDGEHCFWEKMGIRFEDKIILVRFQDVFWFQSKGNFLYLHLEDRDYNCRMTMKDLLPRLAPGHFLRVHRNAIVNLDHVLEFDLPRCGNAFARFRNGTLLPISRAGRIEVRRSLLGHSH